VIGCVLLAALAVQIAKGQQPAQRFGGAYADLGERRQKLVDDWVVRFNRSTGQALESQTFYDTYLRLSTKTTFEAVSHALMTTALTDASGASLGDALALVDHVNSVRGEIPGARGDRQFRMYVRLVPAARATLERSREFRRGIDNTIYHHDYPLNYRGRGGVPSIQISIALDNLRADVDVDYRSATFPISMVNGHLSAANSDVRAGNNADRHTARWAGFQNWWRNFFGVRLERDPEPVKAWPLTEGRVPRAGQRNIDVMVRDFMNAWLIEGDVVAAMGYIAPRAYACVADYADDSSTVDLGMAPFQLMNALKATHDALGKHDSLERVAVGVRLSIPAVKVVQQPYHAQFVLYAVPDDVAAGYDCENRLRPGGTGRATRTYGNYYGSTFYINGRQDLRVAILWARDGGYWKIVSWKTGVDDTPDSEPNVAPKTKVAREQAEPRLVEAARGFLESWLIRKDYDDAFRYLSTRAYGCYDLVRGADQPASTSVDDAGRRIRAGIERVGESVGNIRRLEDVLMPVEVRHVAVRAIDHPYENAFVLGSIPNALGDASECAARVGGFVMPDPLALVYGNAVGMAVRFRTGGEGASLLLLWRQEEGAWRIRSYDLELP
jgi:hypothetical protein